MLDDKKKREPKPAVQGSFNPDLPIKPEDKGAGNYQAYDGHWYVIMPGHGRKENFRLDTPEKVKVAKEMIHHHRMKTDKAYRKKRRDMGLLFGAVGAFTGITPADMIADMARSSKRNRLG
jgi:hypothetical protein